MSSTKPSIYIDTNIFSVLHYRGGDPVVLDQQSLTRGWWELERCQFNLYTSRETERELERGNYPGQERALSEARRLAFLRFTNQVHEASLAYIKSHVVPASKPIDAFQLAFASVHMIDYLLTWNYAHLARSEVQQKLDVTNRKNGWRAPLLCTPGTIPRKSWGQSIRRRNE